MDSSSIEVPRRARRSKSDRIDLVKLMGLVALWRYLQEGIVPEGARLKPFKARRAAA